MTILTQVVKVERKFGNMSFKANVIAKLIINGREHHTFASRTIIDLRKALEPIIWHWTFYHFLPNYTAWEDL